MYFTTFNTQYTLIIRYETNKKDQGVHAYRIVGCISYHWYPGVVSLAQFDAINYQSKEYRGKDAAKTYSHSGEKLFLYAFQVFQRLHGNWI